jgi:hypothetical protein
VFFFHYYFLIDITLLKHLISLDRCIGLEKSKYIFKRINNGYSSCMVVRQIKMFLLDKTGLNSHEVCCFVL